MEKFLDVKLLVVHRYFYPDTPTYAKLLGKLAKFHSTYIKKVEVLTAMPSYYGSEKKSIPRNENYQGIKIKRVRLLPEARRNFLLRLMLRVK